MNVRSPLYHSIGGIGIHHVEYGMDDLVAADAEDSGTRDLLSLRADQHL